MIEIKNARPIASVNHIISRDMSEAPVPFSNCTYMCYSDLLFVFEEKWRGDSRLTQHLQATAVFSSTCGHLVLCSPDNLKVLERIPKCLPSPCSSTTPCRRKVALQGEQDLSHQVTGQSHGIHSLPACRGLSQGHVHRAEPQLWKSVLVQVGFCWGPRSWLQCSAVASCCCLSPSFTCRTARGFLERERLWLWRWEVRAGDQGA